MLIDTHCHIHETDYPLDVEEVIARAHQADVGEMICVGTSYASSEVALEFANNHDGIFAAVGIHPYESKDGLGQLSEIVRFAMDENFMKPSSATRKLVAIGEIGLDYHHDNNPRDEQIEMLRQQIDLALKYDLPIIFHVREAFADFWPIYDEYITNGHRIRGVLHSFTDDQANLDEAIKRGLYIGVNGYSTFIKDEVKKAMYKAIPLGNMLLETDAPFLTPVPFRGRVNEPAFVRNIAEFINVTRLISLDEVAETTTMNARTLFKL